MKLRSKSVDTAKSTAPLKGSKKPKMSRDEELARTAIAVHDSERERFVQNLKRQVRNGEYSTVAAEIADALLQERNHQISTLR